MSPRSVRFRLTASYAAILATTFAAAGLGIIFTLQQGVEEAVDQDLRLRVKALQPHLGGQPPEHRPVQPAEEGKERTAAAVGAYVRLADAQGRWIYRSPGTLDWTLSPPTVGSLPERGQTETVVVNGKTMRLLSIRAGDAIVQIGTSIDYFTDLLSDFTWTVTLASPALLLLAATVGYWMSGRALTPVDQIARTAKRISAESLSERLPLRNTGDELDRLSATLNEVLAGLEASFHRITQFTADASHELRTPLAIMRTTAEVIQQRPRTVREHEAAWNQIITQAERTSRLIDDLLMLARADAGHGNLAFEPMDLAEAVRETCKEIAIMAETAGVRLKFEDQLSLPSQCTIRGDPEALRRLLLILLDNAIKYTQRGGDIQVSLENSDRAGKPIALVEVRDTGIGISETDLAFVFDRFYRLAKDRSRKSGGAGLGLSIAQWIATCHGGKIEVESVPGSGSAFRVVLPRVA